MTLVMKGLNASGQQANASGGAMGYKEFTIQDSYATAIPFGDPVALSGGYLVAAGASSTPYGVLRGVRYIDATGKYIRQRNFVASTANSGVLVGAGLEGNVQVVALVEPVDNRSFLISATGTVAQSSIGGTKLLTGLNTADVYGNSTATVDMSSTVSTENMYVRILGIFAHPDNALGSGTVVEVEFAKSVGDN